VNILSLGPLLATVIYPQYFWYQLYPDSTSSASPTIIGAGSSIVVSVKLVYHDSTADVELPTPTYWVVKVTIYRQSDGSLIETINFGVRDEVLSSVNIDGHFCTVAVWEDTWSVPATLGVTYRFEWSVQIKDGGGNDYGTQTYTTYAKTADIEPDGVFKVNGVDASQTSSIVVLDPDLVLDFVPIKNAEKITGVVVQVWKGGVQNEVTGLTLQGDGTYRGTYQLPGPGTYELKGLVEWSDGPAIPKMSLVVGWGEEAPGGWVGVNQIIGLVFMTAGAFLVAKK